MDTKEIQTRLEIIKLATSIGEHNTIELQINALKRAKIDELDEIISLLSGKNYRQALYLIKNYLAKLGSSEIEFLEPDEESERVLNIEDMLRMSPLAKDTIKDYKRNIYTQDDLESFSKNIEKPIKQEYEQKVVVTPSSKEESNNSFIKEIEQEAKENIKAKANVKVEEVDEKEVEEVSSAINSATKDTPLDEISSNKESRVKNLSKYKKLREKFAKKESKNPKEELKSSKVAKSVLSKVKDVKSNIESKETQESQKEEKKSNVFSMEESLERKESKTKEQKQAQEKKDSETIYSPIPHIEQKFRQAFILYPPLKENEVWTPEVVKFMKYIAKNSFTQRDVNIFLDEYSFYLEKNDIAKAAQVLLLAASTESEFAQFILARELFSGKILVRDIKKSFELMKKLANKFYPDAVCDLAQFYEYGIGVPKDKTIAIKLYEKAFQLGVSRATKHINRLKESNSFFSTIFKLK